MSLVIPPTFQHILRVMNTNIDGKRNIMFAITSIKGIGRRYANLVLKKVSWIFAFFQNASIKAPWWSILPDHLGSSSRSRETVVLISGWDLN